VRIDGTAAAGRDVSDGHWIEPLLRYFSVLRNSGARKILIWTISRDPTLGDGRAAVGAARRDA
jgi:hypothetical protein